MEFESRLRVDIGRMADRLRDRQLVRDRRDPEKACRSLGSKPTQVLRPKELEDLLGLARGCAAHYPLDYGSNDYWCRVVSQSNLQLLFFSSYILR
jgi:hypothetical protein